MIIKHVPNAEIPETDTDKLSDIEAMILEKSEELRQLCFDAQRQMVIVVDAKGLENGTGMKFWNMKMKNMAGDDLQQMENNEDKNKAIFNLFRMLHGFTMGISQNAVGVADLNAMNKIIANANQMLEENEKLKKALTEIADYDGESIWQDSREDAANGMLSVARQALGREE